MYIMHKLLLYVATWGIGNLGNLNGFILLNNTHWSAVARLRYIIVLASVQNKKQLALDINVTLMSNLRPVCYHESPCGSFVAELIPYKAKLSWLESKMVIRGENFHSRMLVYLYCQSTWPQIHGKTFAVEWTTTKTANVFALESFTLCGILGLIYHLYTLHVLCHYWGEPEWAPYWQ